jgi:MATE family multidrug resistance protein
LVPSQFVLPFCTATLLAGAEAGFSIHGDYSVSQRAELRCVRGIGPWPLGLSAPGCEGDCHIHCFTWHQLGLRALRLPRLDLAVQRELFRLGLPAAGHTALEIGAFTLVTFVVGAFGAAPLAAHHACLIMAAFTFMFPLGFGSAAAVRVGTFIGAGQPKHARIAGWLCIGIAVAVMSCFAVGYLAFPRFLLRCFTDDPVVIDIGAKILLLVALFQIADGAQVSTTGALRGLGNTQAAMIANLIGHYPIGLALGLILCFMFKFGVVGLWVGLAMGLIAVALMLVRAWVSHTRNLEELKPVVGG